MVNGNVNLEQGFAYKKYHELILVTNDKEYRVPNIKVGTLSGIKTCAHIFEGNNGVWYEIS